jgi:hypothetical protein
MDFRRRKIAVANFFDIMYAKRSLVPLAGCESLNWSPIYILLAGAGVTHFFVIVFLAELTSQNPRKTARAVVKTAAELALFDHAMWRSAKI